MDTISSRGRNVKLKTLLTSVAAAGLLAFLAPSQAIAQNFGPQENYSVTERPRPEYDPIGLEVGAFRLLPYLTGDVGYYDNVFATQTNRQGDVVLGLSSGLDASSTWSRHQLRGSFQSRSDFYQRFEGESRTNYRGDVEGRLDLGRNSAIGAGGLFRRQVEPRTSPETPVNAAELVRFNNRAVFVYGYHTFNRLRLTGRLQRTGYNFADLDTLDFGRISLADRDRVEFEATGRADYSVSPDTSVFFEGAWNRRDYGIIPASGVDRNSQGQTFLVGARTNITRLLRGEVAVGYLRQNYQAANVDRVGSVSTRVALDYFVSPLTTVHFDASRRVLDTGVLSSAGLLQTDLGVQVDHELLRNVLLHGGVGYQRQVFRGLPRADRYVSAEAGAKYLINRHLAAGISYNYLNGRSNDAISGRDYSTNGVRLSLTVQL